MVDIVWLGKRKGPALMSSHVQDPPWVCGLERKLLGTLQGAAVVYEGPTRCCLCGVATCWGPAGGQTLGMPLSSGGGSGAQV